MRSCLWLFTWLLATTTPNVAAVAAAAESATAVAEIDGLLTAWHHAAAVADEDTYFGLLAEDAVFLGTDASERWTKAEFEAAYLPYFQRESAWVFVATQRRITLSQDGRTAWFDELLDSKSYWTSRGSGVLTRNEEGRWRLRQYNLAFTIPNAISKQVKALVEQTEGPARQ
jgi:ketosteroid isomerase-like protein